MSNTAGIVSGVIVGVGAAAAITGALVYFILKKFNKLKRALTDPDTPLPVRIVDRQQISPDTIRLIVGLPDPDSVLGLPVGNHVKINASIVGTKTVRPYTPVSAPEKKGYAEFVIKVYKPNEKFPNGGKMSQYLDSLPVDGFVDLLGPAGNLTYRGKGRIQIKKSRSLPPVENKVKEIAMICGGTGITPMYQMLKEILKSDKDTTKVSMIFANNKEDDILLRDELDELSEKYRSQFRVWYTLVSPPENWLYSTGFIDEKVICENIAPPSPDNMVLLCGPPPMIDRACMPNLRKLNYSDEQIFVF